jgi:hypothetical protein
VREDVEGLQVRDAQRIREVNVYVEPEGAEDALFSREERGATTLVRAFGDVVRVGLVLLELGGVDEGGREGREVCVDVDEAAWGRWVCGEFGSKVERGC